MVRAKIGVGSEADIMRGFIFGILATIVVGVGGIYLVLQSGIIGTNADHSERASSGEWH
jgi:hypothetical protein